MQDQDLILATNARPAVTPGGTIATWLFPTLLDPAYIQSAQAIDIARGGELYANFRIATSFSATASNYLRFCVIVDDVANFANVLTNTNLIIARGPDIISSGLSIGHTVPIPVPPLNDIAIDLAIPVGKLFLGVAMQAYVPTTDWSAGGVDIWLSPHPHINRPVDFAGSW